MQSTINEAAHAQMMAKAVADYPQVVNKIDEHVSSIVAAVGNLPPDQLLSRAWHERVLQVMHIEVEAEVTQDDALASRMVDYIQSVIASAPRGNDQKTKVSDGDWAELKTNVEKLYKLLHGAYLICATAHRQASDAPLSLELEEFMVRAQLQWCNVRGDHYSQHQIEAISGLLLNQSELIEAAYGITTAQLIEALNKLWHAQTYGLSEAMTALKNAHEVFKVELERLSESGDMEFKGKTPGDFFREITERLGLTEKIQKNTERVMGLGLFDVQQITNLPQAFLDDFSWSPGEDSEFLAEGVFKGWPLRIQPIFRRPFIKVSGKYLCFDLQCLFDNFYRQIEKRIFLRSEMEKQRWIANRKDISERLPIDHFLCLLPGATVLPEVYYPMVAEQGKRRNFAEADCILIYDDHLFAIEVKAGAFTYTSPSNDLPAYVKSLQALVGAPAQQGDRFLDYLDSADEVEIFDAKHRVVGSLRKADFRVKTICAVTLDPFTELAAQSQHLHAVGVELARRPVWSLSISDLRVYRDVFAGPLEFLHFVEQRMRASISSTLRLDDELDHFGLYLAHNQYAKYAESLAESNARVQFNGYRSSIDRFYTEKLLAPNTAQAPLQQVPHRLHEIINFLMSQSQSGRSQNASYLLDLPFDVRAALNDWIDSELADVVARGRCVPMSVVKEGRLTVVLGIKRVVAMAHDKSVEHCRTVMAASGEDARMLLELTYDDLVLCELSMTLVTLKGLSNAEVEVLREQAKTLKERRVARSTVEFGKIGRNELCPCGSGSKYKRCCLK
ncbi:YecA family protein [Comamonas sp. CMM02]|uniref:YecA family protein n=1 Tax=Comamonas sp. CMM02 TaxID=2769307 RepID=UPI001CE06BA3|nr:SEC-C metal-binding domain-containing protein [Comamonas sp. CMM02]